MIKVDLKIDSEEASQMYRQELKQHFKEMELDLVYWDLKELSRRTCMSIGFIRQQFFYDPRFPKVQVNKKWYMPAAETKQFLIQWLLEQKREIS